MKTGIYIIAALLWANVALGQVDKTLGFDDGMQGYFTLMNFRKTTNVAANDYVNIRTYNFVMQGNKSILGEWLTGSYSDFFIGDYIDMGLGVGMGKRSSSVSDDAYNGTTFTLPLTLNIGLASSFKINEDITVGLKWILIGGDLYFDFDQSPTLSNRMSFFPTFKYKNLWFQAGYGTRVKDGIRSNTFTTDARIALNSDLTRFLSFKIQNYYSKENFIGYDSRQNLLALSLGVVFMQD